MDNTLDSNTAAKSRARNTDLTRLLSPRAVAVVGASEDGERIGGQPLRFLTEFGYRGNVYPVNPKYSTIRGLTCFHSVAELPQDCDLALVAVAAKQVPRVIAQCGDRGIPFAVVLSAGFREIGAAGAALEAELKAVIERTGVRMVGPNCLGVMNVKERVYAGFGSGFQYPDLRVGPVAMVTQSGGYGFTMVTVAEQAGIGFSHIVSTGNSTDLNTLDFLEHFLECDEVEVIATFIEGISDGRRLVRIGARALEVGKPILVWKAGNSAGGQRAAASHTASLTASYELYRAAFRRGGFIEIRDYDDLVDIGRAFQARRLPAGDRIAVVTGSGGAGVLLTDRCDEYGMVLPQLSDATLAELRKILPDFASPANPVDISGQRSKDGSSVSNRALEIMLADPGIDQIILRSKQSTNDAEHARELVQICAISAKPVLVSMGADRDLEAIKIFDEARVSWHITPPRAARAAGALHEFASKRRQFGTRKSEQSRTVGPQRLVLPAGAATLSEHSAKACLAAYGIPVVREALLTLDEIEALKTPPLAFPLAVKINSADIPHKTEAGAIRLGIADLKGLKAAAREVWAAALAYKPDARLDGVLVQEMATGTEVIVGAINDACFGPTVVFGLGGIFAEVLHDVTHRFAPFGLHEAREMIEEIRGSALFRGYRGRAALDVAGLAQVLSRVSWLAADHAGRIAELDINPLFVTSHGVTAADALITVRAAPAS